MSSDLDLIWHELREHAGPYAIEAYQFVKEGLRVTAERVYRETDLDEPVSRHLTGQQLCFGLKDHAIDQYGLLSKTVLNAWGIHRTEDFGRIVFTLVDLGELSKTDEDRLEDFGHVYDFDDVFGQELDRCLAQDLKNG